MTDTQDPLVGLTVQSLRERLLLIEWPADTLVYDANEDICGNHTYDGEWLRNILNETPEEIQNVITFAWMLSVMQREALYQYTRDILLGERLHWKLVEFCMYSETLYNYECTLGGPDPDAKHEEYREGVVLRFSRLSLVDLTSGNI